MEKKRRTSGARRPFNRDRLERALKERKADLPDGYGTVRQLHVEMRERTKRGKDAEGERLSWLHDAVTYGEITPANQLRLEKHLKMAPGELSLPDPPQEAHAAPSDPEASTPASHSNGSAASTESGGPAPPQPSLLERQPGAFRYVALGSLVLFALWSVLPISLLTWIIKIGLIGAVSGSLIWHSALRVLKKLRLEPDDTDPFGGRNEAQLYGGAAVGLTFFLPLAVLLARADVNTYGLPQTGAVWASVAFLCGSTAGSALFYGSRVRHRVYEFGWSHMKEELLLVILWSSALFGPGFLLYAIAATLATGTPLLANLGYALAVTLIPVVSCLCTVYVFIGMCVTPQDLREDLRGAFNGGAAMIAIALAHDTFWRLLN